MTRQELDALKSKAKSIDAVLNKANEIERGIDQVECTIKCINELNVPYDISIYKNSNCSFSLPFNEMEMIDLWRSLRVDLVDKLERKKEKLEKKLGEIEFVQDSI